MELNQLLNRPEALLQTAIAAMNGPAHRSGIEMSLECDIRCVSSATMIARTIAGGAILSDPRVRSACLEKA